MSEVLVVRTGVANLASVLAALERAGASPRLSDAVDDVVKADRLVLPGVGAFGAAIDTLRANRLAEPLRERIAAGRPTLAVCVGMQVLAETSEESPEATGLGVLPAAVGRFHGKIRVPQLGWNEVVAGPGCNLLQTGYAYYANSYRLSQIPPGWSAATSEHGGSFVAALEKGSVLACQFHPELSGAWGASLLSRWMAL